MYISKFSSSDNTLWYIAFYNFSCKNFKVKTNLFMPICDPDPFWEETLKDDFWVTPHNF